MDKNILKLLPQKAFKLLSVKETLKIGTMLTRSAFDKHSYESLLQERLKVWKFEDIILSSQASMKQQKISTKEDGERVLKIYFSQFYERSLAVHIDLRASVFSSHLEQFYWTPSKLHYYFSAQFLDGICSLYEGFYLADDQKFENGLKNLGMIRESMSEDKINKLKNIFYNHFGEGKSGMVQFSLLKLQDSFNSIFSYFLKEDIPLNPEFAVLGVNLATLYLTLQDVSHELNVHETFLQVYKKYQ